MEKDARYLIGVDMGGTKIAAGVVDLDGNILFKTETPTGEPDAALIAEKTAALIHKVADGAGIDADGAIVGIGVPGSANREDGTVEYANNIGMENVPFVEMMGKLCPGMKIMIENDANAAAYAEYVFGAGVGASSMVMVTLGTGIGAGIVIDGKIFEGVNYAAGEIGHMTLVRGGLECSCGRRGCFEMYASASALVRDAREAAAAISANRNGESSLLTEICGGDLDRLDGKIFFEAARRGDVTARRVLDAYVGYLSDGLTDIVNIFEPELIVVGGGISREGEFLLAPVRAIVERDNYGRASRRKTRIVAAALGNDAGVIGAAHLAYAHMM